MVKMEHEVPVPGVPQSPKTERATVVNIHPDTVVPDHIVWSLFSTLFFNPCCLGLAAFAYSVKSRDRRMVGDLIGAQNYASTAKSLNIWAVVLGVMIIIGFYVFLLVKLPELRKAIILND